MYDDFDSYFRRATRTKGNPAGFAPYPYQRRLAEHGLPELIEVPTGLGKTLGVVAGWLYRRRLHPDLQVRAATPRRLVFVLPMRVLVEQTHGVVRSLLQNLGLADDIPLRTLMGGEPMTGAADWRLDMGDSIVVGTVDMVLSRCLNRGYGESRYLWPIDFGLLHADSHFVFDELQLMGPALSTSRQLHGLRASMGTAASCSSTWMSATVDYSSLLTFDAPEVASHVSLGSDDLADPELVRRVRAEKRIVELELDDASNVSSLAEQVSALHRSGTLTLVIMNTVERAVLVHAALVKIGVAVPLVLLHSRFRPGDRATLVGRATELPDADGPGMIVVSTQVVEAGIDISAALLVTEVAPWPSLVQRAGRCNRTGSIPNAALYWVRVRPERSAPYSPEDVAESTEALLGFTGSVVASEALGAARVAVKPQYQPTLRRRDLLDLFDTLPDVSGNDVDVSRFIRDSDDLDVSVAWRPSVEVGDGDLSMPGRDERCPVAVHAVREWMKKGGFALRWNALRRSWERCSIDQLRPGAVLVVDSLAGGYTAETGWSPHSKRAVDPVVGPSAASDAATADDPISVGSDWVLLRDHLDDTCREIQAILGEAAAAGLTDQMHAACIAAARYHDIGKAHAVFRDSVATVAQRASVQLPDDEVFAKTGVSGVRLVHSRPNFRHELASALALLGEGASVLSGLDEADLVVYLVAAHHGRVRMGIRSLPGDTATEGLCALGVIHGEQLPSVRLNDMEVPASALDLGVMALGGGTYGRSWSARALGLRDRVDIGVFRLGFMEAVVRLADWRASAAPTPFDRGGH